MRQEHRVPEPATDPLEDPLEPDHYPAGPEPDPGPGEDPGLGQPEIDPEDPDHLAPERVDH
jgi:hypothetical protein